jgi:hypothetical protein
VILLLCEPPLDGGSLAISGGDDDNATISMIYEVWALIGQQHRFF